MGARRIILICLGFEVIEVLSLSDRCLGTRKQLGDLGARKQRDNIGTPEWRGNLGACKQPCNQCSGFIVAGWRNWSIGPLSQ